MDKQQVLTRIALLFQSGFRNYILNPTKANASKLSANQKRMLDGLISNPSNYSLSDLQDFIDGSVSGYTQKYNNAKDALEAYTPTAPEAVSTTVVGTGTQPGQVPVGSMPTRTDIEPGELSRPAQPTGAGVIEPGEMSRPGMGAVSGATPTTAGGVSGIGVPAGPTPYEELPDGVRSPTPPTTGGAATTIPGVEMQPATDVIPEDWEQAAKEQYGAYWAIFQYQPELQQLLIDATREGWDPSKFQYQLEQTGWWQTTTESARLFDAEEATDPATVQTNIDNQVAAINQIALNFGVRLSSETAAKIARDSLRGGWATNPALMQTAITNEATKSTGGVSQLRAGYIGQQIREAANMYGVNLGDAELNSWVQKWASGAENQQSVTAAMQEWSKVLYPSISTYIDQGRTFQDIVAPYKSVAAGLLELEPGQIDFTEPKWLAAISQEDKAGQQKLMSASEWQREIRTNRDFGFEFTKQAQDQAYLIANQMAELFGRV